MTLEVDGLCGGRRQLGSLQAGACGDSDDERRKRQVRSLLEGAAAANLILDGIEVGARCECR